MQENQISTALGMLYLCGCVLTGTKPEAKRLEGISLKDLYEIAKFHSLSAIVSDALEKTELSPASEEEKRYLEAFASSKKKSVRKNLLLDTERMKLFAFMEQKGIWHMPLKGVILKDMYPKMGLRQMSDNDILFDENYRECVRDWFVAQGYTVENYGNSNHDVYLKEPVYNYEMHVSLYGEEHKAEWCAYYENVKEKLVKDEDTECAYHFTDEDFYIYFLAHGFKHFDGSGTGVRFLLDQYVYSKAKGEALDFAYIERELQTLGLMEFEKACRELICEIFEDINAFDFEKLTQEKREMFTYFLTSGTYGTMKQRVDNIVKKEGKCKYLLSRLFPGTNVLKLYHPVFRHKWLMPIGWIYRAFKLLTSKCGSVLKELKLILTSKGR